MYTLYTDFNNELFVNQSEVKNLKELNVPVLIKLNQIYYFIQSYILKRERQNPRQNQLQ